VRYSICTVVSVQIETMLVYPTMMLFGAARIAAMCYALKANLEDDYLAQHLPGYEAYRHHVKYRLIPKVW
jgi:protein-S-isoprenylcysteine O-methyltransferase Ste14